MLKEEFQILYYDSQAKITLENLGEITFLKTQNKIVSRVNFHNELTHK